MATAPRKCSSSGFYHVFHRGVNNYDIFECDEDRRFYLEQMSRYAKRVGVEVHAWCLMSNHTHMLVHAELDALAAFMRLLGSTYARYFNKKYSRVGPLFGGRFSSVCVETESQLVVLVRYIHRNPYYHDEEALFSSYPWSSYSEYLSGEPQTCTLSLASALFGNVARMAAFHEMELPSDHARHLDLKTAGAMRDDEARQRANAVLRHYGVGVEVAQLGTLTRRKRDESLALVKSITGCSLRQLQRLTAIAYSAIKRAVAFTGGIEIEDPSSILNLCDTTSAGNAFA